MQPMDMVLLGVVDFQLLVKVRNEVTSMDLVST
jgi:hypothetical protein